MFCVTVALFGALIGSRFDWQELLQTAAFTGSCFLCKELLLVGAFTDSSSCCLLSLRLVRRWHLR
jgi:hypothetical protein